MTTWPESVPTPDAAKPEASSASANSTAAVDAERRAQSLRGPPRSS